MRTIFLCLLALGCSKQSPSPQATCAPYAPPPVVIVRPQAAGPTPTQVAKTAAVVKKERHLVAEAGRYVVWKQSKAPIIDKLGTLTAEASKAVQDLQDAKTLRDRAAALPAAEAAVDALSVYLQTKGD
jgi:hypothetical protein